MTTSVSRHQKGKTILDFDDARDDGVAVASAGPCKSFAPRSRHITTPTPSLNFYKPYALPDAQATCAKAPKAENTNLKTN